MTEPITAFSSSSEDAITRTIDVNPDTAADKLSVEDFNDYYEIEETAAEILKNDYKRIALQFPDELLHDSVPIYQRLKGRIGTGRELYVLADTSYGSCCVDEVASQHVDADAMIHYGYACMSQTSRLPVVYVFGKKKIDINHCAETLVDALNSQVPCDEQRTDSPILLQHDVAFTHLADDLVHKLKELLSPLGHTMHYTKPPTRSIPATEDSSESHVQFPTIFYIGQESLGLTNLIITNAASNIISYDPATSNTRFESSKTNKLLMRRYVAVQKARDADVFGILVGTLGVASYLPMIKHLRTLLAKSRKKSYTICVGRLNPAKLANFLEIECFVLVACPENSLIEAKDFLRPIVTPFELKAALQAQQTWTGRYVLDFGQLLAERDDEKPVADEDEENGVEEDIDKPMFSLITGKYRHAKRYGDKIESRITEGEDSSAVILRNQEGRITRLEDSAAAQFLHSRTYRGLDPRVGQDAPGVLEQGRSGLARGYEDVRTLKS
ncbi:putative diphthamide synthesis protein-domain-containing protein [Amanita rubescens]|nr:putative diphthamide synthesis protein-domain-containing protein [Amanita rubescens]